MQNNSTGMLATSVPVGVVPSAPRWPSWKIHTSAPNAAVSESTLSTSALSGSTTLPVSRNSSPKVMTAISPSTPGSRDVMASTLSRLICAMPVNSTGRPAGPGTACSRSSWVSRGVGEQRRGAADGQERAAVAPPRWPPTGGPTSVPADERARSALTPPKRRAPGTARRRSARDRPVSGRRRRGSRRSPRSPSCRRSRRATGRRPDAPTPTCGSTRSSGKPHLTPRNGAPSTSSSATTARPIGSARRMTNFVDRYQNCCSIGR